MSAYYPQGAMILRVLWEDFGNKKDVKLQEIYTLPIIARRMTVNVNDYSQADTFDCEIDYKNFPFDPRCIRACGVSIFMQDMRKLVDGKNNPVRIVPADATVIFQGFVDEESITFNENQRTVKMEGRDLTALLIDRKYIGPPLDVSLPVDKLIAKLLIELKETQELKLDNRVPGNLPILSSYSTQYSNLAGKKNIDRDHSYWDVIQGLVHEAGLIAYIEIDKLVLSKPRVLYDNQQAKIFVYGKNLKNIEFKRKLGRRRNFNVVVRSLASVKNTTQKKPLKAEIPKEASAAWSKETGIENKEVMLPVINTDGSAGTPKIAPFLSFLVTANTQEELIKVGQEIYEELGRQQIEGSCETSDMETTHKAINFPFFETTCYNILKLRNGTPISIEIEQGDLEGIKRLGTVEKRTAFLIARCYAPKVAQVLAETIGKNSNVFYTKSVQFSLSAENGFKAKIDFLNFIQIPKELAGG